MLILTSHKEDKREMLYSWFNKMFLFDVTFQNCGDIYQSYEIHHIQTYDIRMRSLKYIFTNKANNYTKFMMFILEGRIIYCPF